MEKFVDILGVPFLHTTQKDFVEKLHSRAMNKEKTFIVTANPEIVMLANEDSQYMSYIQQANYVVADGIGVVKAANMLKTPLPERVTGYDTMIELLKKGNEFGYKIYLLGAQEETLVKTVANIKRDYPNVQIVGSHNGFFNWEANDIQEEIKELEPDFIFVALGVPRQEKWISSNIHSFEKGIFMGIGGSFDVIAGTVPRAPQIWQKLNLEWAYRLMKQPSRIGRMMALPRFVLTVMKKKAK